MIEQQGPARPAQPRPPALAEYYQFDPIHAPAERKRLDTRRRYSIEQVVLPTKVGDAPIRLLWFAPRRLPQPAPLILLFPINNDSTLIVGGYASMFAAHGYHAVIVNRLRFRHDPQRAVTQVEDYLRDAIVRYRQALDWLVSQPEIDPTRVGTFGISYGGIMGAILAGVEPRVRYHAISLAGGPLSAVMRHSVERSIRRNWHQSRRAGAATNHELTSALRQTIRTDPIALAPYVPRDSVFLSIALFDRSVATAAQLRLRDALDEPTTLFVPFGHYTALLAVGIQRVAVMRFFQERFGTEPVTGNHGLVYGRLPTPTAPDPDLRAGNRSGHEWHE